MIYINMFSRNGFNKVVEFLVKHGVRIEDMNESDWTVIAEMSLILAGIMEYEMDLEKTMLVAGEIPLSPPGKRQLFYQPP